MQRVTEILKPTEVQVVIYHAPCADGFGAAYVAHKKLGELAQYIGLHPKDPAPIEVVRGKRVLMVDLAWPLPDMLQMQECAQKLVVLDHHETNYKTLAQFEGAHFDMQKSGVMLAWEYFFPDVVMPNWLLYVGLRDIWKHKENPDADAFTTGMTTEYTIEAWGRYEYPPNVDEAIERGRFSLDWKHKMVQTMAQKAAVIPVRINGIFYKLFILNVGYPWISDVGDFVAQDADEVAVLWSKSVTEPISVSLRSAQCGPNVATLAEFFGGGGHAHAAAFRTTKLPEELFAPYGTI